jgi:hypothetical protein
MYVDYHGRSDRRKVLRKLGGEVYSGVNFCDAAFCVIRNNDKVFKEKDFLYRESIEMLLQMCRCMASAGG